MKKKLIVGIILAVCFFSLIIALAVEPGNKPVLPTTSYKDAVGVIYIEGVITGGASDQGLFGAAPGTEDVMTQLREAADNDALKAVVIRVNSPGGSAAASQEIGDEVERLRQAGKKVVISMGDVAASGGYWIAAKGDKIVANPATITGSIGVIMESMNLTELYDKIGVADQTIKSGPHKDMGSPSRLLTPEEKDILQAMVDDIYEQFVDVVVKGRNMKKAEVKKLADGRIFTGRQAKELGLVDELGNFYDAVKVAGEMAGIKGEPKIIKLQPEDPWSKIFSKAQFDAFTIQRYVQFLKSNELSGVENFILLRSDLISR